MSTVSALQQLNTISNPGGTGVSVTTYASEMQQALTLELTTAPDNQLSTLQSQQTALTKVQTALQSLQTATDTLASSQNWNTVTATSNDTSSFTVTALPGALASNYSVAVTQLAQNDTWISTTGGQSSASGSSSLQAGTLTITPSTLNSSQPVSVSITAGESLDSIVSAVNQNTSQTGVQAQVIYNGSTYQLALSANQTGTNEAFTASDTSSGGSQFSFSESQKALNAEITLDNVNISSQTNTFSSAIPNVTINALQKTASGVSDTISVTPNASSVVTAVQTWMTAYNAAIDLLKTDTAYTASSPSSSSSSSSTSGTAGPLFSDMTANGLLSQMPATVNQTFSNSLDSAMSSLATIGIVEDPSTGHLEFQPSGGFSLAGTSFTGTLTDGQTTFENAVNSNAAAVQNLFGVVQNNTASSAISTTGVLGTMTNFLNSYLIGVNGSQGTVQIDLNSITGQENNIQSYLTQINQQITNQVSNFTTQLNALNAALQQSSTQTKELSALINSSSSSSSSSTSSTG